jgi:hypothetical protein
MFKVLLALAIGATWPVAALPCASRYAVPAFGPVLDAEVRPEVSSQYRLVRISFIEMATYTSLSEDAEHTLAVICETCNAHMARRMFAVHSSSSLPAQKYEHYFDSVHISELEGFLADLTDNLRPYVSGLAIRIEVVPTDLNVRLVFRRLFDAPKTIDAKLNVWSVFDPGSTERLQPPFALRPPQKVLAALARSSLLPTAERTKAEALSKEWFWSFQIQIASTDSDLWEGYCKASF